MLLDAWGFGIAQSWQSAFLLMKDPANDTHRKSGRVFEKSHSRCRLDFSVKQAICAQEARLRKSPAHKARTHDCFPRNLGENAFFAPGFAT
jgi:hypothetical protein